MCFLYKHHFVQEIFIEVALLVTEDAIQMRREMTLTCSVVSFDDPTTEYLSFFEEFSVFES